MSSRLEQAIVRLERAVGAVEAAKMPQQAPDSSAEVKEIRKLIDDAMEILTPNEAGKHEGKSDGK